MKHATPTHIRLAYRVGEAAQALGIGRDSVYSAIRDGRLPARKWGKITLIRHADLEAFINELPLLELDDDRAA